MRRTLVLLFLVAVTLPTSASARDKPRPAATKGQTAALHDERPAMRRSALNTLLRADPATIPASTFATILDLGTSDDEATETREAALQLFGEVGPRARTKRSTSRLLKLLDLRLAPPPGKVRGWAAWTLGKSGAPVKQVGLALVGVMGPYPQNDFTRAAAMEGFQSLGGDVPGFLRVAIAASEPGYIRSVLIELLASRPLADGGLTPDEATGWLAAAHRTEREPLVRALVMATPATVDGAARLGEMLRKSQGYFEQSAILRRLKTLGPAAGPAVPAMCELLRKDSGSLYRISEVIEAAGPSAYTPCLAIEIASHLGGELGYTAATSLAHLGDPGLAQLVAALDSTDTARTENAFHGLREIQPPPILAYPRTAWLTRHGATIEVRRSATWMLAAYGDRAQRRLVSLLRAPDAEVRAAAAAGLTAPDAYEELVSALDDPEPEVSNAAERQLSQLGLHPARTAVLLFERGEGRYDTAKLISPLGEAAVEPLIAYLDSQNDSERARAATVLAHLAARSEAVVPRLAMMLDDRESDVRSAAAYALASFGAEAASAEASLRSATLDDDWSVRSAATHALGRVGSAKTARHLAGQLPDAAAAKALGNLGTKARAALPQLIDVVTNLDNRDYDREAAIRAIGEIGVTDRSVSTLRAAMDDPERDVRVAAARVLQSAGSDEDKLRASDIIEREGGLRFMRVPELPALR